MVSNDSTLYTDKVKAAAAAAQQDKGIIPKDTD